MGSSVRSYLMAGVTAIAVSATAIAPSVPTSSQAHASDVRVAPQIDLAASVRSLVTTPPNPEHMAAAKAAIARIDPAASAAFAVQAAAPVPLNAASDGIVSAYQLVQSWVTYGVQLANYALQFVPFGSALSGQINILYYTLGLPIADSIVYGLVVPVVNDPLNPASYVNGLATVGQATVNALINTGIAEFNYFFGWLIPPLPPLPLAAARTLLDEPVSTMAADLALTTTAADAAEPTASPSKERPSKKVTTDALTAPVAAVATETPGNPESAEVAEPSVTPKVSKTPKPTKNPEPPATTTSVGGVHAQGEVRGGNEDAQATSKKHAVKGNDGPDKPGSHGQLDEPRSTETSADKGGDAAARGD